MEKKKQKEVTKTKVKRKRQTSIITIALWLFLIATMVTITTSNAINKEALEVTDNNWNITLTMAEDDGAFSTNDVTWNATSSNDAKILRLQINYACTTGKEYAPGEIEITIPGIAEDSFSEYHRTNGRYDNFLANNVIAADKSASSTKQYDWSYSYDSATNTYTFTNNNTMAINEHFEGSIQIAYNMLPRFKIQTDLAFQAKMKENITGADKVIAMSSNTCNFHYTGTKTTYSLIKIAYTGNNAKGDFTKIEDILDDYYWVKYCFMPSEEEDGTIIIYDSDGKKIVDEFDWDKSTVIKELLPEGCVIYDNDMNEVIPKTDEKVTDDEGNTYYPCYYLKSSYHYYYIGYPKSKYKEGDSVTNKAELWRTI